MDDSQDHKYVSLNTLDIHFKVILLLTISASSMNMNDKQNLRDRITFLIRLVCINPWYYSIYHKVERICKK